MRVLFLMFAFPNMEQSFNMYTTIAKEFVNNGHDIVVVAPSQQRQITGVYNEAGIDVLRVNSLPIKNVSNLVKGISNLLLPYQFSKALRKYYPKHTFDLIIIPTPPITLVDLAAKLKRRYNAKLYLILRDIFPQNAVDLGFMKKNSIIYRYFRAKEKKLYREADYIGCMSQGNIDYILENNSGLERSKLHELKNFQYKYNGFGFDTEALREKYGLKNRFVLVFGGNMGKPQQLENILNLAKKAMKYPDVIFLLLGEGVLMQKIAKQAEQQDISNIRIISSLSKQEYQDLINGLDMGIISLHQDFTIPNIPSKSVDYWNVGLPILASIDRATDYNDILDQNGTGLWSYADDNDKFFENFEKLYSDKTLRKEMSENGRSYFINNLTPEIIYKTIIKNVV